MPFDATVNYSTYAARCTELGEANPESQEELASWLHDLGIALNYGRDPRLRDTSILRPDWLANGIYAVLRANDPRHKQPLAPDGIVSVESLERIYAGAESLNMLRAADYPAAKWQFLLRLMTMFQLSYPLDDAGEHQLVPTLLPLEEPSEAIEPSGINLRRIRYEFSVVPAPLMPRLLVRTFGLIKGNLMWRRGAVYTYGSSSAKIWTTQDERWIYLTIGSPKDAENAFGDLSTILRGVISDLLTEYRSLRVVEQLEWQGQWVPRATLESLGAISDSRMVEGPENKPS